MMSPLRDGLVGTAVSNLPPSAFLDDEQIGDLFPSQPLTFHCGFSVN